MIHIYTYNNNTELPNFSTEKFTRSTTRKRVGASGRNERVRFSCEPLHYVNRVAP